jgi:hypothetical protein
MTEFSSIERLEIVVIDAFYSSIGTRCTGANSAAGAGICAELP